VFLQRLSVLTMKMWRYLLFVCFLMSFYNVNLFRYLGMCVQRIAQQRLIYEMIEFLKMWRYLLCFNSLQSSLRSFRDRRLKQLRRNAYMCVNFKLKYILTLRHNRSRADAD
jgi:hypothetical protein